LDVSYRVGLRMVTVVGGFDLGRGGVVQLAVDALLVELGHPAAGGDLEVVQAPSAVGDEGAGGRFTLVSRVMTNAGGRPARCSGVERRRCRDHRSRASVGRVLVPEPLRAVSPQEVANGDLRVRPGVDRRARNWVAQHLYAATYIQSAPW
jgi:hypothetical protein